MADEKKFDHLIKKYASQYRMPWLLIKAQIWAESSFDPNAESECGAKGLMQLMPETAKDMSQGAPQNGAVGRGGEAQGETKINLFDPEINIELGVKYDRWLYDRFPEISPSPRPSPARGEGGIYDDRLKFMLAAYNCGRGYVNQALRLAREAEFGYQPLAARPGQWQTWDYSCTFLSVPLCEVNGKHPDYRQTWDYVEKIWKKYQDYSSELVGARSSVPVQ